MKKYLCALLALIMLCGAVVSAGADEFTEAQINAYQKRAFHARITVEEDISALDLNAIKLVYEEKPDDTYNLYITGFDVSLLCNPNASFLLTINKLEDFRLGLSLGYMKVQVNTRDYADYMLDEPDMYYPAQRTRYQNVPFVSIDKVAAGTKLDLVNSTYRYVRRGRLSYEDVYGKALTPLSYRNSMPHVPPAYWLSSASGALIVSGKGSLTAADLANVRFVLEPLENGLCRIWGENIAAALERINGKLTPQYDDLDLLLLYIRKGTINVHTYNKSLPFVLLDDVAEEERANLTLVYTNEDYVVPAPTEPDYVGPVVYDKGSEATKSIILAVVRDDDGSVRWIYPLDYDLNVLTYKNDKVTVSFMPSDEEIEKYLEEGKITVKLSYYKVLREYKYYDYSLRKYVTDYDYTHVKKYVEVAFVEYSDVQSGQLTGNAAAFLNRALKEMRPDVILSLKTAVPLDGLKIGIDPFAGSVYGETLRLSGDTVALFDADGNEITDAVNSCEVNLSNVDLERYGRANHGNYTVDKTIALRNFLKEDGVMFVRFVTANSVFYAETQCFDILEIGRRELNYNDFYSYDLWIYTSIRDFLPDFEDIRIALEYDDEGNAKLFAADENGDPLPTAIDRGDYLEAVVSMYGMESLWLEPEKCVRTVEKAVRDKSLDVVVTTYNSETGKQEVLSYGSIPVIILRGEERTAYVEIEPLASFKLPLTTYTLGDSDGDGRVNARDVVKLMRFIVGQNVSLINGVMDMNADGVLNSRDVIILLRDMVNGVAPVQISSACALFGHKRCEEYATEIVHNAYSDSPHCEKNRYLVISCGRDGCDYIEKDLVSSTRIASCHG